MRRRWEFWNVRRLSKELDSIPQPDRLDLLDDMDSFLKQEGIGYEIDEYEGGIKRIKHTNRSSGRCLFFIEEEKKDGTVLLVALTVYKKEKTGVPSNVLDRAQRRRTEWQQRKTT